jgi:hypothetical protein
MIQALGSTGAASPRIQAKLKMMFQLQSLPVRARDRAKQNRGGRRHSRNS